MKGSECPPLERIRNLTDEGSSVVVNSDTKIGQYIRSGRELYRCAKNYDADGECEHALVLYTRFLTLFVEQLHKHPAYKEISPQDKKQFRAWSAEIFSRAEVLKSGLLTKFQKEHDEYQRRLGQQKEAEEARRRQLAASSSASSSGGQGHNSANVAVINNRIVENVEIVKPTAPPAYVPPAVSPSPYSYHQNSITASAFEKPSSTSTPQFDRTTKPSRFLSSTSMSSGGLREMVIPGDLIPVFLRCAEKNTERNIETCGFLTGRIHGGKLVITDLIIPKQDGTSDSCTAKGDEEYIAIQDRLDLITFGWIHTHPSQTAFLSSVDMHCQYGYQQMLPEAIAIVCAPSKDQVGTFTLNPVEGMEIIGKCPDTSGFHTHPQVTQVPLFIDATHHHFDTSRKVAVHDLRFT